MTMQEVITLARGKINEMTAAKSHFTESELLVFANAAIRYIYQNLKSIPREYITETIPSSGEVDKIDLSSVSGLLEVIRAEINNVEDELIELSVMDYDSFSRYGYILGAAEEGQPTHFVRMGIFDFRLYPPPADNWQGEDLNLIVKKFPADIGLTDTPSLPDNMIDIMPDFVAWKCFDSKLQQADRALLAKKIVDEAIALHIGNIEKQRITNLKAVSGNTLDAILYSARDITGELSLPDSQYSMEEMYSLVNEGIRYIYQGIGSIPREEIETSVPDSGDTSLIDISDETRVMNVMAAYLQKDDGTDDTYQLGLIDYDTLTRIHPEYIENTSDEDKSDPVFLVRMEMFKYKLFPTPKDTYMGNDLKLMCKTFPEDISDLTDVPELPNNLIDLLPHYVAHRMYEGKLKNKDLALVEKAKVDAALVQFKNESIKTMGNRSQMRWDNTQDGELS